MTVRRGVAAVTGASGYLGGLVCRALEADGWDTIALVRTPREGSSSRGFHLGEPVGPEVLAGCDLLVHCAYDFSVTSRADIWRVNVDGSRRLLLAARDAGVARTITLSSMSAYTGTRQLYGQAKLAIEAATRAMGGTVVRPGLVYGDAPGGMVGALVGLTSLPLTPIVGGSARQYPVHEGDVAATIVALAAAPVAPDGPLSICGPLPVPFRELLDRFARAAGHRPRFVSVPWPLVYWALRAAELLPVRLPFRADSLLGLVRPAPAPEGLDALDALGVHIRPLIDEEAA